MRRHASGQPPAYPRAAGVRAAGKPAAVQRAAVLSLLVLFLLAALHSMAGAQEIEFHPAAGARDDRAAAAMRDLAQRLLPVYQEKRVESYLSNLSAMQLVAGDLAAADATRQTLAKRRQGADAGPPPYAAALLDIYVHARLVEAREHVPFEQAFAQTYRDVVSHLSDQDAYAVTGLPPVSITALESAVQAAFDQRRVRASIPLADGVELVWAYFTYEAYRHFGTLVEALGADDDRRRYIEDDKVTIRTPDGARIAAVVVRPRAAAQPRPALLEFTSRIAVRNFARECAAHGYVGVVAAARGHGTAAFAPFEHEGADAEAVIAWIAQQGWSDGRVAMYGEGYSAFTQWAAAKRAPPALKAIAGSDAMAPGIDFPMAGNIFQNTAYRWLTTLARTPAGGREPESKWQDLYRTWYVNGDPSGDLDGLFGQPSAAFHRWLDHPGYDSYWQAMIPYGEQFAHVDVPVLSIAGYYAAGQAGALYYFQEHTRLHPHADHTLLVGPYDEGATRREAPESPPSTPMDPSADIGLRELRYQWFDFILRGGAKPALLQDRVNYQVIGADTWRHAPSIAAMSNTALRFYLDRASSGDAHRLSASMGSEAGYVRQVVDLADRRDVDSAAVRDAPGPNLSARLTARNDLVFVSDALVQPVELAGLISARLDFLINKRDVDLTLALYERLADGQYLRLFSPSYAFRASNAGDRIHRHLLHAGLRQQLDVVSERVTSRMIQAGSRIVVVLGVNKRMDQEINLGTGRNVRDEYVEYAGDPLEVRWYGDSFIDLPVRQ